MAALMGKDVKKLKAKGGGKWKYMSEKDMLEYAAKFAPYRYIVALYNRPYMTADNGHQKLVYVVYVAYRKCKRRCRSKQRISAHSSVKEGGILHQLLFHLNLGNVLENRNSHCLYRKMYPKIQA